MKVFLKQFMRNIKMTLKKTLGYPISITILIILCFVIFFFFMTSFRSIGFKHMANVMLTDIKNSDKVRDSLVNSYANVNNCTTALANQYKYIKNYKHQNVALAEQFEVYYYGFVLISIIGAVLAGLLGILIAKDGWQHQPKSTRAAFIGFVFCASFSGVCVKVFNNAENANKNVNQYFYFTNLQTNIYNVFGMPDSLNNRCADSTLVKVFNDNNENMKKKYEPFPGH